MTSYEQGNRRNILSDDSISFVMHLFSHNQRLVAFSVAACYFSMGNGRPFYLQGEPTRYFHDIKSVEGVKTIILLTLFQSCSAPVRLGLGLEFMVLLFRS